MATEEQPALKVVFAAKALQQLGEIWNWNAERYNGDHADKYIAFLMLHIDRLNTTHRNGNQIGSRPELRYVLVRRRPGGHGHVAVYRVEETQVNVLRIFHTSQDWQTRAAREL